MKNFSIAGNPTAEVSTSSTSCRQLIHESDSVTAWYDSRGFIYTEWRGYLSVRIIKEKCLLLFNKRRELKCTLTISDTRQVKGTWLQVIPWLGKYLFPLISRSRIDKIAIIYQTDTHFQRAIERTVEVSNQLPIQIFTDYKSAEQWVLDQWHNDMSDHQLENKLAIREKEKYTLINFESIRYVYSHNKGTAINCKEVTHYTNASLREILDKLPENFIQIHRSYAVNNQYVVAIKPYYSGSYHLFLKDLPGIKIPVSKKYIPTVKSLLQLT